MNELRYIRILKIFITILLVLYIGGVAFPWFQISTGYDPAASPQDTVELSPTEYATAASLSVAMYGAIFVVPLLIASVHTLRALHTKRSKRIQPQSTES